MRPEIARIGLSGVNKGAVKFIEWVKIAFFIFTCYVITVPVYDLNLSG